MKTLFLSLILFGLIQAPALALNKNEATGLLDKKIKEYTPQYENAEFVLNSGQPYVMLTPEKYHEMAKDIINMAGYGKYLINQIDE